MLPQHEFALDVIALVGALHHAEHRSVPEIHTALRARGVDIAERTVTHLLHRYDELLSLALTDTARLRRITHRQRHVVLALDGLQPDVGHEVLWVVRDCVSGEILTAGTMLSAREADLAPMLREVKAHERDVVSRRRRARLALDPASVTERHVCLDPERTTCACCGETLAVIGEERREVIEREPARYFRVVRAACP